MRYLFLLAVCIMAFGGVKPAQAGFVEFFFPSLAKKEPDLRETLRAPFADAPIENEGTPKKDVFSANSVPLNLPHHQKAQMAKKVSDIVSEALVFEADDYRLDLEKILAGFSDEGQEEYEAFLEKSSIQRVLDTKGFYVRSFVTDTPIALNSGEVQGRYRWLFDVPVTVSYLSRKSKNYKGGDAPTNQKMTVRLQVGRHDDAPENSGVFVEKWSAKIKSVDRP